MAKLVKISVDPESMQKTGRYKDKEGYSLHGIFKRDYIKTKDVLFISNGILLNKYKFPKIKTRFNSPMLNFFNLHLCGGWFWPNINVKKEILRRVIKGLKPMGDIVDKIAEIREISNKAESAGLEYSIIPHFLKDHREITFCKDGKFEELFDVEALFSDYSKYYFAIFKKIQGEYQAVASKIANRRLSDFLDFNVGTPGMESDLIITGLILGYPIWSTVSVMWM